MSPAHQAPGWKVAYAVPGKYALSKWADTPVVFFFFFPLLAVLRGMWDRSGMEPMPLAEEARSSNNWAAGSSLLSVFLTALLQSWAW